MWDTIFKTGTHTDMNGVTRDFTRKDIARLAKSKGDMPVVIHHPKKKDTAMKFGAVDVLRSHGDLLQAKYKDVPAGLEDAVMSGLQLNKSVAFDPETMELDHLGLLGVDQHPAVEGLGNVQFAKDKQAKTAVFMFSKEEKENTVDEKDKKITELEQEIETMKDEDKIKTLETDLEKAKADLETEKKAHGETTTAFAKFKTDQDEKVLEDRVEALATTGRINPADKEKTLSFAKSMSDEDKTMKFAKGDGKEEDVSPREAYLLELEAQEVDGEELLTEFAHKSRTHKVDIEKTDLSMINNHA